MSLTNCPDCDHEVSDWANVCPQCGRPCRKPVGVRFNLGPSTGMRYAALSILARLTAGGTLLAGGIVEGGLAGVIGGAIILGSVVPAWYRGQLDRVRNGLQAAPDMDDLGQRVRFLEREYEALVREMEERLDHAERLPRSERELSPIP